MRGVIEAITLLKSSPDKWCRLGAAAAGVAAAGTNFTFCVGVMPRGLRLPGPGLNMCGCKAGGKGLQVWGRGWRGWRRMAGHGARLLTEGQGIEQLAVRGQGLKDWKLRRAVETIKHAVCRLQQVTFTCYCALSVLAGASNVYNSPKLNEGKSFSLSRKSGSDQPSRRAGSALAGL